MTIIPRRRVDSSEERSARCERSCSGSGPASDKPLRRSRPHDAVLRPGGRGSISHRLERLADAAERETALTARNSLRHVLGSGGDPAGAFHASERALPLVSARAGAWSSAVLHARLAQLSMHLCDPIAASRHRSARPASDGAGSAPRTTRSSSLGSSCVQGRRGAYLRRRSKLDRSARISGQTQTARSIAFTASPCAQFAVPTSAWPREARRRVPAHLYQESAHRLRRLEFPGIFPGPAWTIGACFESRRAASPRTPPTPSLGRSRATGPRLLG